MLSDPVKVQAPFQTLESLIAYLKQNPSAASFDSEGRMVIRLPTIVPKTDSISNNIKFSSDARENYFCNSLLHYGDRIARLSLPTWLEQQTQALLKFQTLDDILDNIQDLAPIFNQTSLILTYYNLTDLTQKYLSQIICFFNKISNISKQADFDYFALQAWINWGRLDRLLRQNNQAIEKFEMLSGVKKCTKESQDSLEKLIITKTLSRLYEDKSNNKILHGEFLNVVMSCRIYEPIRTYLDSGQFEKIIQNFQPNLEEISKQYLESIKLEAVIISEHALGNFQKALDLARAGVSSGISSMMHIFIFRELELLQALGQINGLEFSKKLEQLFQLIMNFKNTLDLNSNSNKQISELIFSSAFAKFLSQIRPDRAMQIYAKILKVYEAVQDEAGQIQILQEMLQIEPESESLKIIFNKLLKQTHYFYIRRQHGLGQIDNSKAIEKFLKEKERVISLVD